MSEAALFNTFSRFDYNRTGSIEFSELRNLLHAIGWSGDDATTARMLATYDTNRDGRLTFSEFLNIFRSCRNNYPNYWGSSSHYNYY